jgi:succinoglycan biosynthesis transport protein ExoP
MDIRPYFAPLFKWWWLIAVATVLAAVTSYLVVHDQPPVYTAHTTLIIGKVTTDPNPDSNEFWLNQQLASFYMDLTYRDPIRDATMAELGIDFLPSYTVKQLGNNQFLEIDVTDTDPERAKIVADELGAQLIKASPGSTVAQDSSQDQFTADQLKKTQDQIIATEDEIAQKQIAIGSLTSAHELEAAKQDLQTLQDKLQLLQSNYANLLANSAPAASNTLEVIEPASVPSHPSGMNKSILIAISSLVGLILGAITTYLLEGLDNTIKGPRDVEKIFDAPTIGFLMDVGKRYDYSRYVERYPRSMLAEAFRSIRTNLEIRGAEEELKILLVTSPDAGDGKSSVSVNLAINLAQGGKQVILIDGDMRRSTIHRYFDMENGIGLAEVLKNSAKVETALHKWSESRLRIITAGKGEDAIDKYPTPADVEKLFERLRGMADVIIVDTPPFMISDTLVFTAKADGVLVVIRPGHTTRELARLARERIASVNGKILGVILNRIPMKQSGYYGDYRYYMPQYYYKEPNTSPQQASQPDAGKGNS